MGIEVRYKQTGFERPVKNRVRLREFTRKALERGESISSGSGVSLTFAVAWCEEHREPYEIHAHPGIGYVLKLKQPE